MRPILESEFAALAMQLWAYHNFITVRALVQAIYPSCVRVYRQVASDDGNRYILSLTFTDALGATITPKLEHWLNDKHAPEQVLSYNMDANTIGYRMTGGAIFRMPLTDFIDEWVVGGHLARELLQYADDSWDFTQVPACPELYTFQDAASIVKVKS